jgi:hypothetical protein
MTGPRYDHATLAGLERVVALGLEASTVLLGAMWDSLTPTTPPKSLRACLGNVHTILRLVTGLMARRAVATPDDDPPDVVRADAELRAAARALREQAEAAVADLTRLLDTPRSRRGARARAEILMAPAHR